MTALSKAITDGHFAEKQLASKSRLINWSHRSRFEVGLRLAREFAGRRVLDYGSGDGSFLAMLMNSSAAPALAVGAELDDSVVAECRARLGTSKLDFIAINDLQTSPHDATFDAVICMEVLEHVVNVLPVLDRFTRLLSTSGKLLISVPVETGLPLLVKQPMRRIAGWRGIGDYPGQSPYTIGEFATSILTTGKRQHVVRPVHVNPEVGAFHDHKGFNWMLLKRTLQKQFNIERVVGSPLAWMTPHLASQVWFVAKKKQ